MIKKVAVVFPGQGSQYEGMGKDIINSDLEIGNIYKKLDSIVGKDVAKIILDAKKEDLSKTRYAQLAIFLNSVLLYKEFMSRCNEHIEVVSSTGLSLGEYSALCSGEVFDIETGIRLINERGQIMENGAAGKGGMVAVMKSDLETVSNMILEVKEKNEGVIDICNLNSPAQIVVGGEFNLLKKFKEKCLENKIKRVIDLDVEGPFHTDILKESSTEFGKFLTNIKYKMPIYKIYSNYDASEYQEVVEFSSKLQKQMYSPVYFEKIIRKMLEDGVNDFIEIGPGKTLNGFIKKIDRRANIYNIQNIGDVENFEL